MNDKTNLFYVLVLSIVSVLPCTADDGVTAGLFKIVPKLYRSSLLDVAINRDTMIDCMMDTLRVPSVFYVDGKRYEVDGIATWGFSNCGFFKHLVIDEGITTIGAEAFMGCSDMASVYLPSSMADFGSGAFSHCPKLKEVTVDAGNPYYDSRENGNAVIETEENSIVVGCSGTVIPRSVNKIGDNAFKGCAGLQSLQVPSWVESIGDKAFSGCPSLKTVEFSSTGKIDVGLDAFSGCPSLTTVYVSARFFNFCCCNPFSYCENLSKFVVDHSCNNLYTDKEGSVLMHKDGDILIAGSRNASIPQGTKEIFSKAFAGCRRLTKVYVPSSVTKVSSDAFMGCRNLVSLVVGKKNKTYDSRGGCNCIVETKTNKIVCGSSMAVIPEDVDTIGDFAFCGMDLPDDLYLPSHIRYVGRNAFAYCNDLENLTIASARLGSNAFFCCRDLTNVTFEEGCDMSLRDVCPLESSPFGFCSNVSSIRIHGVNMPVLRRGAYVNSPKQLVEEYERIWRRM